MEKKLLLLYLFIMDVQIKGNSAGARIALTKLRFIQFYIKYGCHIGKRRVSQFCESTIMQD